MLLLSEDFKAVYMLISSDFSDLCLVELFQLVQLLQLLIKCTDDVLHFRLTLRHVLNFIKDCLCVLAHVTSYFVVNSREVVAMLLK